MFALNCVLITASELWALRYPDTHELHVLERAAGGSSGRRHLEHASRHGSVRVRSGDLASAPAVVVATEPMDEDPGWRELAPGALLHVDADLGVDVRTVLARPPAHPLTSAGPRPPRRRLSDRGEAVVSAGTSLIYRSAAGYELLMRALYGRHYVDRMQRGGRTGPPGASVLELCCGPGTLYTRYLRERVGGYIGLDVNRGLRGQAPRPGGGCPR